MRLRVGSEKKQHGKHSQNSEALAYASNLHAYVCELKGAGDNSSFFPQIFAIAKAVFTKSGLGLLLHLSLRAYNQAASGKTHSHSVCSLVAHISETTKASEAVVGV